MALAGEPRDERASREARAIEASGLLQPLVDLRAASRAGADRIARVLSETTSDAKRRTPPEFNAYHAIVEFDRGRPITGHARDGDEARREIDELARRAFRFDVARAIAAEYRRRFPASQMLSWMHAHLDGPGSGRAGAWLDDPKREVDVVAKPGAKTTVIAFCGLGGRMGFSLNVLWHMWLSAYSANMIVLRDRHNVIYLSGIGAIGSLKESVAELGRMSRALGATKIVTMGNSAGASGALFYGTLLGADRCLAFAPPLRFPRWVVEAQQDDTRARLAAWREQGRIEWPDARETLAASSMKADIYFGADIERDRNQAEIVRDVPNVTLHPVEHARAHSLVMKALMEQGRFRGVLDEALGPVDQPK